MSSSSASSPPKTIDSDAFDALLGKLSSRSEVYSFTDARFRESELKRFILVWAGGHYADMVCDLVEEAVEAAAQECTSGSPTVLTAWSAPGTENTKDPPHWLFVDLYFASCTTVGDMRRFVDVFTNFCVEEEFSVEPFTAPSSAVRCRAGCDAVVQYPAPLYHCVDAADMAALDNSRVLHVNRVGASNVATAQE